MPSRPCPTPADFPANQHWSDWIFARPVGDRTPQRSHVVGVLEGEGIGPEVIHSALRVLSTLESISSHRFEVRFGDLIGLASQARCGAPLSGSVVDFCQKVFADGGAVLAGPGGGRFVYDLRKQFDLFCKLSPLKVSDEMVDASRVKPEYIRHVDILLVRENVSGIYQGEWTQTHTAHEGQRAQHSFSYTESEVCRLLKVAARIAARRRGALSVVIKDGGIPTISDLWRECAVRIAADAGVRCTFVNVDHAAYCLIHHAQELDVVVAPNLFGDVLADLGGVLLGSRGLTYSGNFASDGAAVYQTNHGAAYDLVGTHQANPVGQILSLAMLLRESLGLGEEARWVEDAIEEVWRQGSRTADLVEKGCTLVGTEEMDALVCEAMRRLAGQRAARTEASTAAD